MISWIFKKLTLKICSRKEKACMRLRDNHIIKFPNRFHNRNIRSMHKINFFRFFKKNLNSNGFSNGELFSTTTLFNPFSPLKDRIWNKGDAWRLSDWMQIKAIEICQFHQNFYLVTGHFEALSAGFFNNKL